jgi:ribosome-associated toxin RatA of RatAB toxin-antitoxin module
MPTDDARASVDVDASPEEVLAVVRDVAAYPEWVKGFTGAEVLETDDAGEAARVRFTMSLAIGTDTFDVDITPTDDGLSWQLIEPTKLQKAQRAAFAVEPHGQGSRLTFDLTVEHTVSVPGFLRKKVFGSFVKDAIGEVRTRV